MGEARRRQATREVFCEVQTAAGGVMTVEVLKPTDLRELMAEAREGNAAARSLHALSYALLGYYRARATSRPKLCWVCSGPVPVPMAVVIVTAKVDDPSTGLAGVVCPACHGTRRQIFERVLAMWRTEINPATRKIDIHPGAGHA